MKKCFEILVIVMLILCCINAFNNNSFSSERYLNNINENLKPFPRITDEWGNYEELESPENFLESINYAVQFLVSLFKSIMVYPVKIIYWIFESLFVVLPGLIWWE